MKIRQRRNARTRFAPLVVRLWRHVDASGGPDACWPWTGARNAQGYGLIKDGPQSLRAHRVAWDTWNEPVPDDLLVCHHCDNPPCCNPTHLFVGTDKDNAQDAVAKGHFFLAYGELAGNAKLTDSAVMEIRRRLRNGEPGNAIARSFHVHPGTISKVRLGRTWAHLPDDDLEQTA